MALGRPFLALGRPFCGALTSVSGYSCAFVFCHSQLAKGCRPRPSGQWHACCIKTQIGPKFSQMAPKTINQHLLFSSNRASTSTRPPKRVSEAARNVSGPRLRRARPPRPNAHEHRPWSPPSARLTCRQRGHNIFLFSRAPRLPPPNFFYLGRSRKVLRTALSRL